MDKGAWQAPVHGVAKSQTGLSGCASRVRRKHLSQTWVRRGSTIHSEAKFLSSCEFGKPNKLCASKIQWWDRPETDIPIKKKDIKKKERALSSAARESPRAAMKTQRSQDYVKKMEGICYS